MADDAATGRPARDDVICVASELGANAIRDTASGTGRGLLVVAGLGR